MMDFNYMPNTVSAAPGRVVLFLVNAGTTGHDLTVLGLDSKQLARSRLVSPGGSSTLAMNGLSPGHYSFFCSQPGHEHLGMVGSLEVT
jgi:plastocyanin